MDVSTDTITIITSVITAGVAVSGLILITTGRLGSRITEVESRLESRIDGVESRLGEVENRLGKVESRLSERLGKVEMETARMNGMLEGLGLSGRLPAKKGES